MSTGWAERLAQERRARLAAERLLEQKTRELHAAHQKLGIHARTLSDQIVEQREIVASALSEAEEIRGRHTRTLSELEQAHSTAVMAERRLWESIEAFHDGFAVFDPRRCLIGANRAYLSIFRRFPEVQRGVEYRRILQICATEGLVELEGTAPEDWIAGMQARWDEDPIPPRVLRFHGDRWVKLMDRRAQDGDIVTLALDITDSIRIEAQLRDTSARAEAASRAKSAFLANMSHEIRTPMNGVVGMAELLCDTTLSEEQRLYAETIRSSGEALLRIINDVLDYSRIEADKLTLHSEPFDLERCIHEVVMLLQPGARQRGIDLFIDYDIFLPTRLVGDPGRVRQVLTNLIGNAVKFTREGHVLVRVTGLEGEGGQQLHIAVEDTGIGIAPEHLEHIFGEFNQVDGASNRAFDGSGLGLAISRQLVERMGGEMWVESDPGAGSCFGFRLTLPVAEEERAAPPPVVALRHALVVDDQLINRTILERQLAPLGLEVTLCHSGAAALAALDRGCAADVVLTDQEMPGMDGLALAARLRGAGWAGRLVLLSSNPARARDADEAAHFDAILQKPLLRRELIRRLAALTQPEAAPAEDPAPPPAAEPARLMRVLSAEDNRTNQLVLAKMLKPLAIDLQFASNGLEAVEMFRTFRPDMIFMDISMPQMDGRDAARAIRAIEAEEGAGHVPIVALTAHAMDGDDADILAAGIDAYLTKPLRRAAITRTILAHAPPAALPPEAAESAA